MSDLISRSELLEEIKSLSIVLNGKQIFSDDAKDTVLMIIKEQPTAYSVDKVVEELGKNSSRYTKKYVTPYGNNGYKDTKAISIHKAIEIVKQGSVSDDVCEWRLCDEEANVYDTSCRNPHILIEGTPKENNYEYCPYCGKKIKAVE